MVLCGTKARGYHPLAQALQRPGARMHAVVARVWLGRQAQRCTAPTLLRILRCVDALGPPCQSARIFCRTLPGCAAVGFVAPMICSTHAEQCLASRWSVPKQPPLIRELTRTGRGARIRCCRAAVALFASAQRCRSVCAVPHSIAATHRRTFSRKSFHAAAWLLNSTSKQCICTIARRPSSAASLCSASLCSASPALHVGPSSEGSGRCLCAGRRELLAHRHVEP
jgi:hypothetical protein